ncbi:hypothetical protein ACG7TL_002093 [Trametes sanguinea]
MLENTFIRYGLLTRVADSESFMLDRLFGAADVEMADEPIDAEDAVEYMDENGKQMESDDLVPHIPRKCCRSPSPAPSLVLYKITA